MRLLGALVNSSIGDSLPPARMVPFMTRLVTFLMASAPPRAATYLLDNLVRRHRRGSRRPGRHGRCRGPRRRIGIEHGRRIYRTKRSAVAGEAGHLQLAAEAFLIDGRLHGHH